MFRDKGGKTKKKRERRRKQTKPLWTQMAGSVVFIPKADQPERIRRGGLLSARNVTGKCKRQGEDKGREREREREGGAQALGSRAFQVSSFREDAGHAWEGANKKP